MKAMLGMLGGGENMSENLSGCLFTLRISLHNEMGGGGGGGGDRTYLSQKREASSRCASQCSSTQTAELVVIPTACSIFFVAGVCEIQLSGI